MDKQELVIEAVNIMTKIEKLKKDNNHPKTLKKAVYKIYLKELQQIKEKLEKYEES